METDEERKERLKKIVATTQLRLALETEDERRTKKRNGFELDLISGLRLEFFKNKIFQGMCSLAL